MQTQTKPRVIHISARRWFQRTYGNTYHSVKVWVDGQLIGHVPFEYGYGSQYLQTARDILISKGIYQDDEKTAFWPRMMAEQAGDTYTEELQDVQRRKDL